MVCTHKNMIKIKNIEQGSKGCEECLKSGDSWVHLRICLTCGHVGCCDQSKNQIACGHPTLKDGVCFGPPARFLGNS